MLRVLKNNKVIVFSIKKADLNHYHAEELLKGMLFFLYKNTHQDIIVVDLRDVNEVDSVGIGILSKIYEKYVKDKPDKQFVLIDK